MGTQFSSNTHYHVLSIPHDRCLVHNLNLNLIYEYFTCRLKAAKKPTKWALRVVSEFTQRELPCRCGGNVYKRKHDGESH